MKSCLSCRNSFSAEGWTCPACGWFPHVGPGGSLSFVEQSPHGFEASYFGELAALEDDSFWFRSRNELILWALRSYFPRAESFFEVGCGTGFVLAAVASARPGLRAVGGELFAEGLAVARSRLPDVPLLRVDARALPFDSEFDVVGAFDVLEHIEEDERAIAELARVVVPGGGVIITVPQHPRLWSGADDYARHERRYRRHDLLAKLERAGFELLHVTSFVAVLLPLLILARRRPSRDAGAELRLSPSLDAILALAMRIELTATRRGVRWPAGGSLVAIGRRQTR